MNINEVAETAAIHIVRIHALAEAGQIAWTELPTPKPTAMRAFQGQAEGYLLNVAQANVVDHGVVHEGMVIAGSMIIRLPPPDANKLYHRAAAQRN